MAQSEVITTIQSNLQSNGRKFFDWGHWVSTRARPRFDLQAVDFLLTEETIHTTIVYGIISDAVGKEALVGCFVKKGLIGLRTRIAVCFCPVETAEFIEENHHTLAINSAVPTGRASPSCLS
jgi:hypothetical protein